MIFHLLDDIILSMNLKHVPNELKMFYLNDIFFYKKPSFCHYHIDYQNKESSLFISKNVICNTFYELCGHENITPYCVIEICNTNEYLNESGFVNLISSYFSKQSIPILYITTLTSNFILFDGYFKQKVLNLLETL